MRAKCGLTVRLTFPPPSHQCLSGPNCPSPSRGRKLNRGIAVHPHGRQVSPYHPSSLAYISHVAVRTDIVGLADSENRGDLQCQSINNKNSRSRSWELWHPFPNSARPPTYPVLSSHPGSSIQLNVTDSLKHRPQDRTNSSRQSQRPSLMAMRNPRHHEYE